MNLGTRIQNAIVALKLVLTGRDCRCALRVTSVQGWQGGAVEGRSSAALPENFGALMICLVRCRGSRSATRDSTRQSMLRAKLGMLRERCPARDVARNASGHGDLFDLNVIFVYAPPPQLITNVEDIASVVGNYLGGVWLERLVRARSLWRWSPASLQCCLLERARLSKDG